MNQKERIAYGVSKLILALGISFIFGSGSDIWLSSAAGTPASLNEIFWILLRMVGEVGVLYLVFSIVLTLSRWIMGSSHSPHTGQNLFKAFLAFVGIIVIEPEKYLLQFLGLPTKTDGLYWLITLLSGALFFLILTLIGRFLEGVDRRIQRAIQSGFHLIPFKTSSLFWKAWLFSIAFAPLFWTGLFTVFFSYAGGSRIVDALIGPLGFVIIFAPITVMTMLTLINLLLYIRHQLATR